MPIKWRDLPVVGHGVVDDRDVTDLVHEQPFPDWLHPGDRLGLEVRVVEIGLVQLHRGRLLQHGLVRVTEGAILCYVLLLDLGHLDVEEARQGLGEHHAVCLVVELRLLLAGGDGPVVQLS